MADKFSALWWNEQATPSGLSKSAIESLTGMTFQTKWNPDNTIAFFWYNDVIARAPGFSGAGLLLASVGTPGDVMQNIGNPNWGDWNVFKSPVGYVAPGATAPWAPTLSPTYTPPPPPPPSTVSPTPTATPTSPVPTGTGGELPPTTVLISPVKPSVMGLLPSQPSLPANNASASIATLTTASTAVAKAKESVTTTDSNVTTYPAFITKIAATLGVPAIVIALALAGVGVLLVFGGNRSR